MSAPGLLPLPGSQALLLAGAGLGPGEAGPPVGGPEDRAMRVLRYKQKRMQRTFKKQVRWAAGRVALVALVALVLSLYT
jgi:hypothetical protein